MDHRGGVRALDEIGPEARRAEAVEISARAAGDDVDRAVRIEGTTDDGFRDFELMLVAVQHEIEMMLIDNWLPRGAQRQVRAVVRARREHRAVMHQELPLRICVL